MRRLAALAASLALLAGCAKSTTTDSAAQRADLPSATSPAKEATEPGTTAETTPPTGRATTTTDVASGVGTGSGSVVVDKISQLQGEVPLTDAEKECVTQAAAQALSDNPDRAGNDPFVSGVVGGVVVSCAGAAKVAKSLSDSLRSSTTGQKMTAAQLDCVEAQLKALDDTKLATLLGGFLAGESDTSKSVLGPIDATCGTTVAP
jgi:hypothetical protein